VRDLGSAPVDFSAVAIQTPTLSQVPSGTAAPGGVVTLKGSHFSTDAGGNVVTFSGIPARVLSASSEELQVEVPECLLSREYQVRVQVGALTTGSLVLPVEGGPASVQLDRGQDTIVDPSQMPGCVHLPYLPGAAYLVVPHSTGSVSGGVYDYALVGLTADGMPPAVEALAAGMARREEPEGPAGVGGQPDTSFLARVLEAQDRWDQRLRLLEKELLTQGGRGASPRPGDEPGSRASYVPPPEPGDLRTFKVLNRQDKFDNVTAAVRYVTDHAILYEDTEVPEGGFAQQDLAALAEEFEHPIHPVVTTTFGTESDLDLNERVIILFTSAVNRLTEPGSNGFIGGFFYGLDLLTGRSGSNEGEIFYSMVPDPSGSQGPSISRSTALSTIPGILAHEFEHMVHFNQRMLLADAESQETLWLSEALAQMAEDLVGRAFADGRNPQKAEQYWSGNWVRARQFLQDPSHVNVLASLPPGTLAERGAGWLLLKQVLGRPGQTELLPTLVSSSRSGIENLTEASGLTWKGLLADWAGSLYLDGTSVPVRAELLVSGVDLRSALAAGDGSYPLQPIAFGGSSAIHTGTLWSSAPDYFIITPPIGGLTLSAGGLPWGPPEGPLGLQTLVVRLQ